jgi:hypothetical protein
MGHRRSVGACHLRAHVVRPVFGSGAVAIVSSGSWLPSTGVSINYHFDDWHSLTCKCGYCGTIHRHEEDAEVIRCPSCGAGAHQEPYTHERYLQS